MKQRFSLVLALIGAMVCVVLVWASCGKDTIADLQPVAQSNESVDDLITSLELANNQLLDSRKDKPRAWYDKLGTFCAVVSADALSGWGLGTLGAKGGAVAGTFIGGPGGTAVGAVAGGTIGAVVGAIGGSYGAYRGIYALKGFEKKWDNEPALDIELVTNAYLLSLRDIKGVSLDAFASSSALSWEGARSMNIDKFYESGVSINIPLASRQEALAVGRAHNLAMEKLLKEEVQMDMPLERAVGLSELERMVLSSSEFKKHYREMVTATIKDPFRLIELGRSKTENSLGSKVMELFVEITQKVVSDDIQDMNDVVNAYLKEIEKSNQLSTQEKQVLYNSLAIAAYSFNYWSQRAYVEHS